MWQSSELLVVEVPTSKTRRVYDEKTFLEFQHAVNVDKNQNDHPKPVAPSTAIFTAGPITDEDTRPLLRQSLETQGYKVTVSGGQLEGRLFAVVDGNHRLAAITSPEVKRSSHCVETVRCGIVHMDSVLQLIEAGTMLNLIRGVQAEDNFYDRFNWVTCHICCVRVNSSSFVSG